MNHKTLFTAAALLALISTGALATDFPHSVQKQCGIEWKIQKTNETIAKAGWSTYLSACAANHKAEGNKFAKRGNESGLDKAALQALIAATSK